jgi:hypothetical protein
VDDPKRYFSLETRKSSDLNVLVLEETGNVEVGPECFQDISSIIHCSFCIATPTLLKHEVSNEVKQALPEVADALRRTPHLPEKHGQLK